MNNIYLLYNFNNYYNRQLKRYATLAEYKTAVSNNYIYVANVLNFTPNDGVDTKHIFNVSALNVAAGTPDYMLVVDDSDVIQSRWFVIDTERTRGQQYVYHLYRDTVAEAWDSLQNAPVFVEKGILAQSDPMILNPENMTFNQIKKKEVAISDLLGIPWIVGYMTQNSVATESQSFVPGVAAEVSYSTLSQYPYYSYSTGSKMKYNITDYKFTAVANASGHNQSYSIITETGSETKTITSSIGTNLRVLSHNDVIRDTFGMRLENKRSNVLNAVKTDLGCSNALQFEDGKLIYEETTQKYWRVKVFEAVDAVSSTAMSSTAHAAMKSAVEYANSVGYLYSIPETVDSTALRYEGSVLYNYIGFIEVPSGDAINYKISNARAKLNDQPYSMFCMPYGRTTIDSFVGEDYKDWSDISMAVAKDISKNFSGASTALYDLQILPYCPITEFIEDANEHLDLDLMTLDTDYSYVTQNSTNIGIIFWCTRSKGKFSSNINISVGDYKLDNETKFCRLCSPNYAGQFEFTPAKNGGVASFYVEYTYKPYNPYIHVSPKFGYLYGRNYGDARGLICGGKFDLPQTSDAWASYERTNANYGNIFNRQISNLELTQKYQKVGDIVGAMSGTVSGAVSGGIAGSVAGPAGAAVGGIIGGVASGVAGSADVAISDKLRTETISYTRDMYGYQHGNIQALPDSLMSVGALTNNFKFIPFVEYYEATDTEVDALKNKIRFNGMSVGRVGTLLEFSGNVWTYSNGWNYFKGKLIRLELDGEDWHFINTIKSELDRGIFIKQEA